MSKFIEGIINAGGDQWAGGVILTFLIGFMATGLFALNSDHMVRCYYLKAVITESGTGYRVMSDVDWAEDTTAFVSIDPKETLEVYSTMMQCPVKVQE